MIEVTLFILWVVFFVADTFAYTKAKWPERTGDWRYKLPGGGFAALRKFGRHSA